MGIFDFFRTKKQNGLKITDDLFGEISYTDDNTWFFAVLFEPIGTELEIEIVNDRNGISEAQKTMFQEIESRYLKIVNTSQSFLTEEIKKIDPNCKDWQIGKELELTGFFIKDQENWAIRFDSTEDFSFWEIIFSRWEPQKLCMSA